MIVCGLRGVGARIVEQLHAAGTRVVIVDDDPDRRFRASQSLGAPHLRPGPNLEETLSAAGVGGAAAVACVERDDLRALSAALLVRELNPATKVVVSLDNSAVGRGVASVTGTGSVLELRRCSPLSVRHVHQGDAHRLRLEGEPFAVAEVRAPRRGTLRELFGDLAPMGVARAGERDLHVCPGRDLAVDQGDRAWLLGAAEQLDAAGLGRSPHKESRDDRRDGGTRGA